MAIRWEPRTELDQVRRRMDRLWDALSTGGLSALPSLEQLGGYWPAAELSAADGALVATIELPGLDPESVRVEVASASIYLEGELKQAEAGPLWTERRYGRFERLIQLPERVREDAARATFKHGLLTVRMPLAEAAEAPRQVKIETE